jgi:hypothetical protein
LLQRENLDARGSEFDGERNAVQAPADFGKQFCIFLGERELGLHRGGTLDEKLDGFELRELVDLEFIADAAEFRDHQWRNGRITSPSIFSASRLLARM